MQIDFYVVKIFQLQVEFPKFVGEYSNDNYLIIYQICTQCIFHINLFRIGNIHERRKQSSLGFDDRSRETGGVKREAAYLWHTAVTVSLLALTSRWRRCNHPRISDSFSFRGRNGSLREFRILATWCLSPWGILQAPARPKKRPLRSRCVCVCVCMMLCVRACVRACV